MEKILYIYFLIISLIAIAVTCADKLKAKKGGRRVPEKTLFWTAIIGGSVAMYFTMIAVRHKTKHKRFMIGLPLVIILQIIIPAAIIIFL